MRTCYICGSTEHPTKDHIPPKNLFVPPLPTDLITVDCCEKCHKGFSLDDEAFRVFASSVNRSDRGRWIWKHTVMRSSFKRSPKLMANVAKHIIPVAVEGPLGQTTAPAMIYPHERANSYLTRITKGLMRHFHPEIDYGHNTFQVMQVVPSQGVIDVLGQTLVYDVKGEGVFRFWRGLFMEGRPHSIWVYLFYDSLMFYVQVGETESIQL